MFPYVGFELLRKKKKKKKKKKISKIYCWAGNPSVTNSSSEAILSRVTTNMLTLATKNVLEWFYLNRETDNSN